VKGNKKHGFNLLMPFLIVLAVRAPTARAPVNSKMVQRTMACLYVTDRDETLVAHALATSSAGEGWSGNS
jgi:hypothetical protein